MSLRAHHLDTVAAKFRGAHRLLSALNEKTPKAEKVGILSAILYLAPATMASPKTVCPYSTAACREGCLFSAGRGRTPRVINARMRRTLMYLNERDQFFDELVGELYEMQQAAWLNGMTLSIRLNGTSDIKWEDERLDGKTLFELFGHARFHDYTRIPFQHRRVPENWHLTWSAADAPLSEIAAQLRQGRNVAAIVPEHEKAQAPQWFVMGDTEVQIVDGEEHDARFLDPSPALVLLKPKGRLLQGPSPMVHEGLILKLITAGRNAA